jgi:hypothetical protein
MILSHIEFMDLQNAASEQLRKPSCVDARWVNYAEKNVGEHSKHRRVVEGLSTSNGYLLASSIIMGSPAW